MPKIEFQKYFTELLGKTESEKFFTAHEKMYRKGFRVNTLKWKVSDFKKYAKKNKWTLEEIPFCKEGFYISLPENFDKPLGNTFPHLLGYGYIQGATSMYPVELLNVKKGETVLDLCAAPGGKSTHIAQKLKNEGFMISNETSSSRLGALNENLRRLGVWNFATTNLNPHYFAENYKNYFDKILVDSPCSGEGMGSKNMEVMNKWTLKYIQGFAKMQIKILSSAFESLKPGGSMVYSTCTLNDIENEGVLKQMQEIYGKNFQVKEMKKFWPHKDNTEGFFASLIYKKEELRTKNLELRKKELKQHKMSQYKRAWQFVPYKKGREYLHKFFRFFNAEIPDFLEKAYLLEHDSEIWIQSNIFWDKFRYLPLKVLGVPILKLRMNGNIDIMTDGAHAFGHIFNNKIELNEKDSEQFLCSSQINGDFGEKAIKAAYYENFYLGLAKIGEGRMRRMKD